jgi:transcriptional regulator with XRE-family HTH domain
VNSREIKFGEMLESLIERGGYSRNRKRILTVLGVSAAALSQYVREQTRPSFSKLLAIADFFDVSLDYLVYGQPTSSSVDYAPLARYVDHALADVQARGSRHSAIVARIGRVLADRIDDAARELASAPAAAREGLIQDDEMLRLESYCRRADILSLNLEFDVIHVAGDTAAGRFLPVVAANLQKGSRYRFLLPAGEPVADTTVAACRSLLAEQIGGDQVLENCAFRSTGTSVIVGAALYQLDAAALEAEEPALHAQFRDHLDEDHWLGCVIRPNSDSNSDMLMDALHTRRAKGAFDVLWATSHAL